jgi:hypothetical protein
MQPKRPNYKKIALLALAIFGGGHLITHGPLLIPWENPPVSLIAYVAAAVEWGGMGVLLVSFLAWAQYKFMALRAQP